MKKFVKGISVFALAFLAACLVVELLLLVKTNHYSYKRDYLEQHLNDISVLLMGNSHIEEGLQPSLIADSAFNMAILGRTTVYDVELAKRYLPQMHHLKVLVMPLDYNDFYLGRKLNPPDGVTPFERSMKCLYYKHMGIRVDGFWYWPEMVNVRPNIFYRLLKPADKVRECDSLGFFALKLANRGVGWEKRVLPDSVDHTKGIDPDEYATMFSQFETIARLAREGHVRLILVSSPMYKTYQELMEPALLRDKDAFVKRLQERFPEVEYYDFAFDDRFVADDFFDSSHLTEQGAAKFSAIMGTIIGATNGQTPKP